MIALRCVGGKRKDGKPCTYEIIYDDEVYVVKTHRAGIRLNCPVCYKEGLKAFKKSPG